MVQYERSSVLLISNYLKEYQGGKVEYLNEEVRELREEIESLKEELIDEKQRNAILCERPQLEMLKLDEFTLRCENKQSKCMECRSLMRDFELAVDKLIMKFEKTQEKSTDVVIINNTNNFVDAKTDGKLKRMRDKIEEMSEEFNKHLVREKELEKQYEEMRGKVAVYKLELAQKQFEVEEMGSEMRKLLKKVAALKGGR